MKTRQMTSQVKSWADKLTWIPEFAKQRLIDWADSLDWDWVLSRQRIFATPIPVWYCKKCNEIILPEETHLPVDPRIDPPPERPCPTCKSTEKTGEKDVLDTWMDSSITAAVHAGWPSNPALFQQLFPADLQPNGLDIIRTWDYYLLVRSLALFGQAPYKQLLINGMVRGTDGRMMHKSYGNFVLAGEVFDKLGADAFRQWAAAGGATGYDIPFRWNEAEYGKKFLTKLWNIARFILTNSAAQEPSRAPDFSHLSVLDRWLLGSIQQLVTEVTESMENFQFNIVLEKIRDFTWHSLADDYIEAVKYRLYPESNPSQLIATTYCLQQALTTILKLLAPICPHITESIYQELNTHHQKSIHLEQWPMPDKKLLDSKIIQEGQIILEIIAQARRKKSEKGLSLKTPLKQLIVSIDKSSEHILRSNQEPIIRTLKAERLSFKPFTSGKEQDVKFEVELVQ
jgi:valyl-tRNA synthetase